MIFYAYRGIHDGEVIILLHNKIKLCVLYTYKYPIKRFGLAQSEPHDYLIENDLFSSWYSCNIAELALNNTHSLTVYCLQLIRFYFQYLEWP